MKQKIKFGNSIIEYQIVKSKRTKTSQITVDKDNVIVRTPKTKSNSAIRQMIKDRKHWIFKKQLEFVTREKIKPSTKKPLSEKYLHKRTKDLAAKIGVKPSKIIVRKLKSRWGSAAKNDTITLNLALTNVPRRIVDYVIIHELCHLLVRNHSYKFWDLVKKFMPDYSENKNWLDNNSIIVVD